jgi:hypothetical protein
MIILLQAHRLSREEIVQALRRGVTDNTTSTDWSGLAELIFILALMAIILRGISMWKERKARPARRDPVRLFHDLLADLHIAYSDQGLLKRLTKDLQTAQPSLMLMSPRLFDETVESWMAASGKQSPEHIQNQLRNIRSGLFGPGRAEPSSET